MPISLRTDEVPHHLRRYFQPADGCGECYICHMVRVFRLVREVMAPHAVCFLNVGDTYANDGPGGNQVEGLRLKQFGRAYGNQVEAERGKREAQKGRKRPAGIAAGNLCLIPQRLALALQRDGWIVRSVIVWHKPAPMPASLSGWLWKRCRVKKTGTGWNGQTHPSRSGHAGDISHSGGVDVGKRDGVAQWSDCPGCPKCTPYGGYVLRRGSWRPTSAWEPVLMLAKSARYYADGEAAKQPAIYFQNRFTPQELHPKTNGRLTQGIDCPPDGGAYTAANLRDVWTIASEPLGSVVIPTRHVVSSDEADGGTVRIPSEDCPVHGHPRAGQTTNKALCDEPEASPLPRKACSDGRPSVEPGGGDGKKPPDSAHSPDGTSGPSRRRTDKVSSRTCGRSSEGEDTRERADGTAGTSSAPVGSCSPEGSPSAKRRSNPSRKKARAPQTNAPSISCERTAGRTERTQAEPLFVETPQSTPANKIELPDSVENRTPRIDADIVGKQQEFHASGPSAASEGKRCTCQYYRETKQEVDHYASFPTELVHRCLRAGTSARGYCPHCGAPWARVVEIAQGSTGSYHDSDFYEQYVPTKTLDWRQTCTCPPHDTRPARVLDPFCGSSRVGVEALRLGMDFTGIDLNPQYVEMSKRILRNESPLFSGVS